MIIARCMHALLIVAKAFFKTLLKERMHKQNGVQLLNLIGLISDTHIPTRARLIPPRVFSAFKGVSLIIHAGDLVSLEVIAHLENIAPVLAVFGNMDSIEVRRRLPKITSVEVSGVKIGVYHDAGALWGTGKLKKNCGRKLL